MNSKMGWYFYISSSLDDKKIIYATYISAHFSCFTIFLASKSSEAAGRRRFARQKNGKTWEMGTDILYILVITIQ